MVVTIAQTPEEKAALTPEGIAARNEANAANRRYLEWRATFVLYFFFFVIFVVLGFGIHFALGMMSGPSKPKVR